MKIFVVRMENYFVVVQNSSKRRRKSQILMKHSANTYISRPSDLVSVETMEIPEGLEVIWEPVVDHSVTEKSLIWETRFQALCKNPTIKIETI